jgi:hypothetical protein
MMANREETRYRVSTSWNYDKEELWINELSAQGLHFKKASLIRSAFIRDESVRYTYRLDFQQGLAPGGKLQEYIDLYADAGWEYVSAFGGTWHYYRREWHEGEEPRLYTDRESLITHYKRIQGDR